MIRAQVFFQREENVSFMRGNLALSSPPLSSYTSKNRQKMEKFCFSFQQKRHWVEEVVQKKYNLLFKIAFSIVLLHPPLSLTNLCLSLSTKAALLFFHTSSIPFTLHFLGISVLRSNKNRTFNISHFVFSHNRKRLTRGFWAKSYWTVKNLFLLSWPNYQVKSAAESKVIGQ